MVEALTEERKVVVEALADERKLNSGGRSIGRGREEERVRKRGGGRERERDVSERKRGVN